MQDNDNFIKESPISLEYSSSDIMTTTTTMTLIKDSTTCSNNSIESTNNSPLFRTKITTNNKIINNINNITSTHEVVHAGLLEATSTAKSVSKGSWKWYLM
jgi:hypothetical protein